MILLSLVSNGNSSSNQETGDNDRGQSFSFKQPWSCCRTIPFSITSPSEGWNLPLLPPGICSLLAPLKTWSPKRLILGLGGTELGGSPFSLATSQAPELGDSRTERFPPGAGVQPRSTGSLGAGSSGTFLFAGIQAGFIQSWPPSYGNVLPSGSHREPNQCHPLPAVRTSTLYLRVFRKQRRIHADGKGWVKSSSPRVTLEPLAGKGVIIAPHVQHNISIYNKATLGQAKSGAEFAEVLSPAQGMQHQAPNAPGVVFHVPWVTDPPPASPHSITLLEIGTSTAAQGSQPRALDAVAPGQRQPCFPNWICQIQAGFLPASKPRPALPISYHINGWVCSLPGTHLAVKGCFLPCPIEQHKAPHGVASASERSCGRKLGAGDARGEVAP